MKTSAFILLFSIISFLSLGNKVEKQTNLVSNNDIKYSLITFSNFEILEVNFKESFNFKTGILECTASLTITLEDGNGNSTSYTYEATAERCGDAMRAVRRAAAEDFTII